MNREVGLDRRSTCSPSGRCRAARSSWPARSPTRRATSSTWSSPSSTSGSTSSPALGKWALLDLPLPVLKANLAEWQRGLADVGWNSLYLDNHDQPRAVSRFGDDSPEHRVASAKTLATVLHLHRGTPYVYQGEELGMTNSCFTRIDAVPRPRGAQLVPRGARARGLRQPSVLRSLAAKGRDNARTPMHWDDSEHAGFTTG